MSQATQQAPLLALFYGRQRRQRRSCCCRPLDRCRHGGEWRPSGGWWHSGQAIAAILPRAGCLSDFCLAWHGVSEGHAQAQVSCCGAASWVQTLLLAAAGAAAPEMLLTWKEGRSLQ